MIIYPMHLKSLRLLNVHLLLYETNQKCGLHIHLMDLPTHLYYNGDHYLYRGI
jgi:hypothetical protein